VRGAILERERLDGRGALTEVVGQPLIDARRQLGKGVLEPESVLFCPAESRPWPPPLLLPQAATNAAVIPRITAKVARKPNPIWRLTLVRGSVAFV
jgi:hypothetical protein